MLTSDEMRSLTFLLVLACGLAFPVSPAFSQQGDTCRHELTRITESVEPVFNAGWAGRPDLTNNNTSIFTESWTRTYDGADGLEDYVYDAATDSQQNVIVAGWSESAASGLDFCVVKYDNVGQLLWTQTWGGTGLADDYGYSVRLDSKDNIIVSGEVVSTGDNHDIGVIKLDPHGNLQWANVYDGPANGYDWIPDMVSLAIDPLDNVLLVGTSPGVSTGPDLLTLKYDPDGKLLWEQRYHNPSGTADIGYSIAVDDLGEIYVAGRTYQASADIVAFKYDVDGQLIWSYTFDGTTSQGEYLYDMEVDESHNVILVGLSEPSAIEGDFVIIKLDQSGALMWVNYYSSPESYDLPFAVAVDKNGNIGVTGVSQEYFSGSVATVCYDKDGTLLWAQHQVGSYSWAGDNASFDIEFDDSGFAYVIGYLYMGVPGGFDAACFKYAPNGDLVGQWQYDGASGGNDHFYGMYLDDSTAIAVGLTTNAVGSPDMLTMKVDFPSKTRFSP